MEKVCLGSRELAQKHIYTSERERERERGTHSNNLSLKGKTRGLLL